MTIIKKHDAEAAKYVHLGATSQDVIDTGLVLQMQQALRWFDEQIEALEQNLITLTATHRTTYMIGRTLLQQAKPITFGLKTAKWLVNIQQNKERIAQAQKRILVLTLGGAVGSGNENIGKEVQLKMSSELKIAPPFGGLGLTELSTVLGLLSGSLGKIAKDIILLMQTEVGEVFEGAAQGKGGSSTMPHKRNPVSSTAILANANRVPHLVATMLSAMPQEHERSAGLWHSEWETIAQIVMLTAGSLQRAVELTANLEIDTARMLLNLEATQGLIYAEGISLELAKTMGKATAHELVEKACKIAVSEKKHLKQVLVEMTVAVENIDTFFMPENAIGNSLKIIDGLL